MNEVRDFITGINYWPINKAMYWWSRFDPGEVEADYKQLARFRFQVVRIFLQWEDFQPAADIISREAVSNLKKVADIAYATGLKLMPTFFCGHMSGVNWFPGWMLKDYDSPQRFPVYSEGRLVQKTIRNYYSDDEVIKAQTLQIEEICAALRGHPAICAYDLGNEASNCVVPPDRDRARQWLGVMSRQVREYSGGCPLTLGMHAEDLEENRQLWPQDAAIYCDFLSMHAYPFYLSWVEQELEFRLVPFLGMITAWLGGKPVMLQEFGVPTWPKLHPLMQDLEKTQLKSSLFNEKEAADYYRKTLSLLPSQSLTGALAWCYGDYAPHLWPLPPLRQNLHERCFGLFRHDGSAKPGTAAWAALIGNTPDVSRSRHIPWLEDCRKEDFYTDPRGNLIRLFARYQQHLSRKEEV
ncbi:glycoside hydrolase 5 family protein [Syntrophomonas curvata]